MHAVEDDLAVDLAAGVPKLRANVHKVGQLPVGEFRRRGVGVGNLLINPGIGLGAGRLASGENARDDDLGGGTFLAKDLDDGGDALADLLAVAHGLRAQVVRADQQHDDLRAGVLQAHTLDAPEHLLGPIGGNTELDRLAAGIVLLPDALAVGAPEIGNRVADEDDVQPAFFRGLGVLPVPSEPLRLADVGIARLRGGAWIGLGGLPGIGPRLGPIVRDSLTEGQRGDNRSQRKD